MERKRMDKRGVGEGAGGCFPDLGRGWGRHCPICFLLMLKDKTLTLYAKSNSMVEPLAVSI